MLVFFLIVLGVYSLVNFYIIRRGWQALAPLAAGRWVFVGVAVWLFLAFPLSRLLARWLPAVLTTILSWIGGFFMAAIVYAFLFVLLVDLLRLADRLVHFFPRFLTANQARSGLAAFWVVVGVIGLTLAGGFFAAVFPRLRTVDFTLARKGSSRDRLEVVMVSDLHLGAIWGDGHLRRIVSRVNALRPDLILLPGDIVDMDVSKLEEERMTATLRLLRAPLGVFAVLGNHENYGGAAKNIAYLERAGVRVLQDESLTIGDVATLVGRKDLSAAQFGDRRKSLEGILETADLRYPLILMDHQPFHFEEAERAGIDLELCGHTHAGQLFPITLINKAMYEQNWGPWRRGRTQYYVSCGAGVWGMPVRTGSVSEIVRLRLTLRPAAAGD
jgi:predicted MPP superfamily phosphohydrolase